MLRWVNLGLGVLLATLLLTELTRSRRSEAPAPAISEAAPVVAQERPGRRSRRLEARMALEEARRRQRERAYQPAGPVLLSEDGRPLVD
jgi:hypothetical protein